MRLLVTILKLIIFSSSAFIYYSALVGSYKIIISGFSPVLSEDIYVGEMVYVLFCLFVICIFLLTLWYFKLFKKFVLPKIRSK